MDDGARCGRCRRLFFFLGIGLWAVSTCLPAFVTPRGQWACPARRVSQRLALLPQSSEWLPVVNRPTVETTDENITVLPVFPLSSVYWPGSEATLQIIDPAYRKMYDDILMSGSRRSVVTFTRSLPGGRVRYADMEEGDRRLFRIGSLLYLTDLEEVSGQTDGHVKYVAKHEVQGRVQLLRLLNPSALFETDGKGNKVNYLRAEARILPEEKNPGEDGEESWRSELLDSWQDFQSLAQKFEEPHIAGDFFSKVAPRVSSGILAAAWQQLQVQTQLVRRQKRAMEEVKKIIEEGRMSQREALELVFQKAGPLDLGWDFWEQLLPLLAANSWQRGELLLGLVREELKLAKTRFALKEALK